jgi:hypothetical protein
VIGLYSSPSFVKRVTEDMKRFLVKFLSLSNISHFTLRDRIAQLPYEDPKVRTILYRIAHITHRTSGTADVQWRSWVKMTA